MNLQNKTAIITGAGRGIGLATCQRFVNEDIENLIMIGSNSQNLSLAKNQLNYNNTFIYQCDLSDKSSINNTFDRILSKFNHVDILINNAGIIDDASFVKMTDIQMKHVLDVNFYGSFYCIKKILPIMIIQNYGKIVNVSSTSKFGMLIIF